LSELLTIENLHKHYHASEPVLKGVSFGLEKGEILALVGSSGCGKSTLLRCIAGFETPQEGTILMNDKVLYGRGKSILPETRSIGFLFQDYALFPHLSVSENIGFGLSKWDRNARKIQIEYYLNQTGIPELAKRYPHEISGGQQQRVALARAMAAEPELMLLDEPFSNIDAQLKHSMRLSIRKLFKQLNTTAIIVTHDIEDALEMADKIAVMANGQIIQMASPDQLLKEPENTIVASFFGAVNSIKLDAEIKSYFKLSLDDSSVGITPSNFEIYPHRECKAVITDIRKRGYNYIIIAELFNQIVEVHTKENLNVSVGDRCDLSLSRDVRFIPTVSFS
jgi:iron(III) transport system ATP-binding protein